MVPSIRDLFVCNLNLLSYTKSSTCTDNKSEMIDQVVHLLSLYYSSPWHPELGKPDPDRKPIKQTKQTVARNITTALVTILTDFKKGGLIPSDVVIRKSLFDDARGERYLTV
jgi:hypothetical protein